MSKTKSYKNRTKKHRGARTKRQRGAGTKSLKSSLSKKSEKKPSKQPICPICLGTISSESEYTTKCNHKFHIECLASVCKSPLPSHHDCPVCGAPIVKDCNNLVLTKEDIDFVMNTYIKPNEKNDDEIRRIRNKLENLKYTINYKNYHTGDIETKLYGQAVARGELWIRDGDDAFD